MLENDTEAFALFAHDVMETQAFTDYVKSKEKQGGGYYESQSEWMQSIIDRYQSFGEWLQDDATTVQYKAQCEMVANFVGDCLFGDSSNIAENLLMEMPVKSRNALVRWVKDFFAKIKKLFAGKKMLTDIQRLEQRFLETAAVVAESRTAENKKTTSDGGDSTAYSINQNFYSEFDSWDKEDTNKIFTIGTTSEALKSVNIKNQEIKMRSGMILQKLSKHPEMSMDIFKKIPELLENPIIIQFSDAIDPNTRKPKYESRITILGELYATMVIDGKTVQKPVLVSLELLPTNQKKTKILDVSFVTSAYGHSKLQSYLNSNSILYIDPNKKRTNKWLSLNRLQLPLGENQTGPIRKITYIDGKVKIQNSRNATGMQQALEKAGVIDSYGNSILGESQNDTPDNESFSLPENQSADVEYSLPPDATMPEILEAVQKGEITPAEAEEMLRPSKTKTPTEIAWQPKEDANWTPKTRKPKMQGEGDSESNFYQSTLDSAIITPKVKEQIENDTFIKNYQGTTNKRTLKMAMEELEEGGRARSDAFLAMDPAKASPVDVAVGIIKLRCILKIQRSSAFKMYF